jgi:hypothetical protein
MDIKDEMNCAGFEVLSSVNLRSSAVFWDVTWCSLVEVSPTFRRNLMPAFSEQKNRPSLVTGKQRNRENMVC